MRARYGLPLATFFVVLGLVGWANPEVVASFFDEVRERTSSQDEADLVGIQKQERWLVIVVDFEDFPTGPGKDVVQAKGLLDGDGGAIGFIEQMSAGESQLEITYFERVIRADHDSTHYGHDSGDLRDVGLSEGGPEVLARQVITDVGEEVDWSLFDLDGDDVVDRLLILHTARPQEDGSGASSRIWSHFGPLPDAVSVQGGLEVRHYTMASLRSSNYRGTIIHEMLHQIGSVDLYAVHDETVSRKWYGVGDWDIMASGNWNGNGAVPALPMAATMELVGVSRWQGLGFDDWYENDEGCQAPLFNLVPMNEGGIALKIAIAEGEWLWLENRVDSGFDTRLPGHGLLVSVQNSNVGDLENNAVNQDPASPWLYIIEADGGDEMLRAADKGSAGDLFQIGDRFGAQGQEVRDSHGRLVQWTVKVSQGPVNSLQLNFTRPSCDSTFEVLPPAGGVRTLPGESFIFAFRGATNCHPVIDIISSDGRSIDAANPITDAVGNEWKQHSLLFSSQVEAGSSGLMQGSITCGSQTLWDVYVPWSVHSNRVLSTLTTADVSTSSISDVVIELEVEGEGSRVVEVVIEGPLARVASGPDSVEVFPGSTLTLSIDPGGLLVPGMLARGQVLLVDDLGKVESIEVEVTGEGISGSADVIRALRDPALLSLIVCALAGLWVLLGIDRRKPQAIPVQRIAAGSVDDFLNSRSIPGFNEQHEQSEEALSSAQEYPFHHQE